MTAAARLLDRLDGVRQTGRGRWVARCPAHDDRTPSLSVREVEDGRVLVHCFAECPAVEVVEAVGLSVVDLFPDRLDHRQRLVPARDRHAPRDVLRALADESMLLLIASVDLAAGRTLSNSDRERLALAVRRVRAGVREAGINV